ncbi:unnamed protein product [Rhizophagus irregularis]|uniref:Uncharacterized protein n=1 Tax=Rhizophagus irregularis TaxID=588596 RepID=A0A915ZU83_9GLOM|nr:unnamed protein product [Rhizophagus irregularis]CAB5388399.1 unnamed protein product [Rhizophagus irregularis]
MYSPFIKNLNFHTQNLLSSSILRYGRTSNLRNCSAIFGHLQKFTHSKSVKTLTVELDTADSEDQDGEKEEKN